MKFIKLIVFLSLCQAAFAEDFTCNDFANYEQEGFNDYIIVKMRNPTASDSLIFLSYDADADATFFADMEVANAVAGDPIFEAVSTPLANKIQKFLVRKYSNMMGFARANQYNKVRQKVEVSLYLSELRRVTIKNCEDVLKKGLARNSFEALMMFTIKDNTIELQP
jgi:hypothetical protein